MCVQRNVCRITRIVDERVNLSQIENFSRSPLNFVEIHEPMSHEWEVYVYVSEFKIL